jgi:hypothetical protein
MLTYILRVEPGLPAVTTVVRRLFRNLYIENNNLRFYAKDIKQELLDRHHAEMTLIEKAAGVLRSETATDETRRRMADALDETSKALLVGTWKGYAKTSGITSRCYHSATLRAGQRSCPALSFV